MKFFMLLRLALWGCLLAICMSVVASNYIVSQTALNKQALQSIASHDTVYPIIRSQLLTPRILAAAKTSDYSAYVTDSMVTTSVDTVFNDAALKKLLTPALDSISAWLNSKQPDASFTVDAQTEMAELSEALAGAIVAHVSSLPPCSYLNSVQDRENGACWPTAISQDELHQEVLAALKSHSILGDGQLTSEQIELSDSLTARTRNLPEYINMLYSAAIFSAGIGVLVILRLLFRYRLIGMATIGLSGLLAAVVLFAASYSLASLPSSIALAPTYEALARTAATLFADETRRTALTLLLVSLGLTLIGGIGWYVLRRHQKKSAHLVHLNTPSASESE